MRLDHVSYATPLDQLATTAQRIGTASGVAYMDGGRHPRFGTTNVIIPLAHGTYIEVVAPLDHPAALKVPFGQAVRARAQAGGGWMGWVVAVDDMTPIEARLGRPAVEGHRVRPDGFDLRWRQLGILDMMADPQLPYFVAWQTDSRHHPSWDGGPASLVSLDICGSAHRICQWLDEPESHPLDGIDVNWLALDDPGCPGLAAVTLGTPNGYVRID